MRLFLIVIAAVAAAVACGPGGRDSSDASVDAPRDAGSGSEAMAIEASPQDGHLDLMVVGLGMVIVAPVGLRRRRETR
jgi:hypothetical protein